MTAVSLDLGSSEFRSMRLDAGRLVARCTPAVYCVVADNLTNRRLLEQARIPYCQSRGTLLVLGESAHELAGLIRCPVIPVILEGHLPWNDPVGRQVCVAMVESLIPQTSDRQQTCSLTLPANAGKQSEKTAGFLEQLLALRGYQTFTVNPATAVCLAEMEDREFTGLSVAIGAESIAMSLTQFGTPVFAGTFARGFRSIEQNFAQSRHRYLWDQNGNRFLDMNGVRQWIRESQLSLTSPSSGDELWLTQQFSNLLCEGVSSMLPDLMRASGNPVTKNRLPVVVSGGPTAIHGFQKLMMHVFQKSCLPFRIEEAKVVSNPLSVTRGLLVHATLHSSTACDNLRPAA